GGDDATASQRGIVTQVADTVSSISNVVDGLGVPLLSSISKPIGWVSNVVSNVASIFGF
nr:Chain D, VP4 of Mud crab dicistrovirus [Mud crab virus]